MIEKLVQFKVRCDVPDCPRSTGCHHDEEIVHSMAVLSKWETCTRSGDGVKLHRCPACVNKGLFPKGWEE